MRNAYQEDMTGKKELSKVKRVLIIVVTTVFLLSCGLYGGLTILLKGPSAYAAREFIRDTKDTPVIADLVKLIADEDLVQAALSRSEDMQQTFCVYPQID